MEPETAGAESVEVSPPTTDAPVPDAGAGGAGESFAEAFAAARAELEGSAPPEAESPTGGDSGESASGTGDSSASRTEAAQPRQYTLQGALDHIATLISQGRESELTGEERGLYNRFREQITASAKEVLRSEVEQERAEWDELVRLARELHDDYTNDRDQFAQKVIENPDLAAFYREFAAEYPDLLTGEAVSFSRDQYEEAVKSARETGIAEFRAALESALQQLASEHGVDFMEHRGRSNGKAGTLLGNVFNAAVEAGVAAKLESLRETIRAEERKAAEQEAAAKYAGKTIIVPKPIGQSGEMAEDTGPISMRQALLEAQQQLSRAR